MMLRSVRAAPATVNLKLRTTHRSEACPPTTPMMGPSYAARRSEFAKQIGLGQKAVEQPRTKTRQGVNPPSGVA